MPNVLTHGSLLAQQERRQAEPEVAMNQEQLTELLLQSLQHERGGIDVYESALQCVVNEDLQEEWQEYLEQTRKHERKLTRSAKHSGSTPSSPHPVARSSPTSANHWSHAMEKAKAGDNRDDASAGRL
jgi:rubrerythrin